MDRSKWLIKIKFKDLLFDAYFGIHQVGILVFTVTKGVQCLFNYVQEQIFLEQLILWKITHHVHKYGCTVRYFFTLRNNTVQLSTMDVVFGAELLFGYRLLVFLSESVCG